MSPVDFNPSSKSIDLQNKPADKRDPKVAEGSTTPNKTATGEDKFVKSTTLQALQNTPTAQAEAQQLQRVEALKAQVKNKTLPILSDILEKRLASARTVANKMTDFEKQLVVLDKK